MMLDFRTAVAFEKEYEESNKENIWVLFLS